MTESKTPPKTAEILEFKPWDYERMFRLARRLWRRPEEPDPEAAEVNDVAGSICYLLCRAMESGAPAPDLPAMPGRVDPLRRLAGTPLGTAQDGREREPALVQNLPPRDAPGTWAGRR